MAERVLEWSELIMRSLLVTAALLATLAPVRADVGDVPTAASPPETHLQVAQFFFGDPLTCAFDPLDEICLLRYLTDLLDLVSPSEKTDRYFTAYFMMMMRIRGFDMVSFHTVPAPAGEVQDTRFISAVDLVVWAYQGRFAEALATAEALTSPEAKIRALLGLADYQLATGDNAGATTTLEDAVPLLTSPLLTGVAMQLAEEIAWAQHRAGDANGAAVTLELGRAFLADSTAPPFMVTLSAMVLAGATCAAASVEEGLSLLEDGVATLENLDQVPDEQLPSGELSAFVRATAEAWAARGYARCGEGDAAYAWTERAVNDAASLSPLQGVHVFNNLIFARE